jgi:phosphoglycolate phosphatase
MVMECCSETGVNPADTIVVGDAVYDMQMAKAAGTTAVGVSWGYASVEDLVAAGADSIAYRPGDVLKHFS